MYVLECVYKKVFSDSYLKKYRKLLRTFLTTQSRKVFLKICDLKGEICRKDKKMYLERLLLIIMLNQAKHISQHKLCLCWTPWNQKKENIKLGEEKQLLIQEKLSTHFHKAETSRVVKKYLLLGILKKCYKNCSA